MIGGRKCFRKKIYYFRIRPIWWGIASFPNKYTHTANTKNILYLSRVFSLLQTNSCFRPYFETRFITQSETTRQKQFVDFSEKKKTYVSTCESEKIGSTAQFTLFVCLFHDSFGEKYPDRTSSNFLVSKFVYRSIRTTKKLDDWGDIVVSKFWNVRLGFKFSCIFLHYFFSVPTLII